MSHPFVKPGVCDEKPLVVADDVYSTVRGLQKLVKYLLTTAIATSTVSAGMGYFMEFLNWILASSAVVGVLVFAANFLRYKLKKYHHIRWLP